MEKQTKSHRARRKKTADNPAYSLIEALKFILPAQRKDGETIKQFCLLKGNWVIATDGVLTIGHPINEDLYACPHTHHFLNALQKVENDLSITQLPAALSVVSGAFRANVDTCDVALIEAALPSADAAVMSIGNEIRAALGAVQGLASQTSQYAYLASVCLKNGVCVGTNRHAMLEAWHGYSLPDMLIPKAAAQAICKTDKALSGFGYSGESATFYFENGGFIKTQLFNDKFPEYSHIITKEGLNFWPLPDDFYKALKHIKDFAKENIVYFEKGLISTDINNESAQYQIEGLPEGMAFNIKYLLEVEPAFKNVCFEKENNIVYFKNNNIRGVLKSIGIENEN